MEINQKIVIITNGNFFSNIILSKILNNFSDWIISVIIITGDYKGRSGFRSLFPLLRVTAFPYIVYKIFSMLFFKVFNFFGYFSPLLVKDTLKKQSIKFIESNRVNSPKVLEWIESQKPDLIVSVSCPQLIGKKILALSRLGGINIHSSLLPEYAGLAPYFWVLSQGRAETGITIHYMTSRFDQGNILIQKKMSILPKESAFYLFYRLAKLGRDNLEDAVIMALSRDQGYIQDLENYSYFSNPSIHGYRKLRENGHILFRLIELLNALKNNE